MSSTAAPGIAVAIAWRIVGVAAAWRIARVAVAFPPSCGHIPPACSLASLSTLFGIALIPSPSGAHTSVSRIIGLVLVPAGIPGALEAKRD